MQAHAPCYAPLLSLDLLICPILAPQYATLCLRENPGCLFVATNMDAVTHLTDAQEWAGGGSIVGAIKGATGLFSASPTACCLLFFCVGSP